jgi:PadR family transcriptional regulator PadR
LSMWAGFENTTKFRVGNFADGDVEAADVVLMVGVVECYRDPSEPAACRTVQVWAWVTAVAGRAVGPHVARRRSGPARRQLGRTCGLISTFYMGEASTRMALLQGTLDLLILRALTTGTNHGLGIGRRVHQMTGGTFDVKPGSLFPALHRLEERGWLRAEWGESEHKRRAKFYALTAAGKRQLQEETRAWGQLSVAIGRALES